MDVAEIFEDLELGFGINVAIELEQIEERGNYERAPLRLSTILRSLYTDFLDHTTQSSKQRPDLLLYSGPSVSGRLLSSEDGCYSAGISNICLIRT